MNLDNLKLSIINPKDSVLYYQDISCFFEDNKGRVWAANYKNGLGYLTFKDFNKGITHQLDGNYTGLYRHNDSIMFTTGKGLLGEFNINTNIHKTITLNNNNLYVSDPEGGGGLKN